MTSRERVLTALTTGGEDRPPIMEMGIDWKVMKGLGYSSYPGMIKGLDLDGITVNQMLYTMGWRKWVIPHISLYTDEWGVRSRMTGELLPIPVEHPIPDPAYLKDFNPPNPRKSPLLKAIRLARRQFPDKAITVLSRNDFAASWFLCGMETLLMSFLLDPDFADRLFAMVSEYYCELYTLFITAGADVIYLTDDYAYDKGTLMSREHFIRFVLPWLEKGVKTIHDEGGLCIKHSDGDLSGVMDLIVKYRCGWNRATGTGCGE
jgi:uroporphyrinogen-III decarboxylase